MAKIKIALDPTVKNKKRIIDSANNNPIFTPFTDMSADELEVWINSALDNGIELKDLFIVLAQIVQQLHHKGS